MSGFKPEISSKVGTGPIKKNCYGFATLHSNLIISSLQDYSVVSPEHLEEEGELTAEPGVDSLAQEEGGTGHI